MFSNELRLIMNSSRLSPPKFILCESYDDFHPPKSNNYLFAGMKDKVLVMNRTWIPRHKSWVHYYQPTTTMEILDK